MQLIFTFRWSTCIIFAGGRDIMQKRKSVRLKAYDYSAPGAYFVTICAHQHQNLFGVVANNQIVLNELGKIVDTGWQWLSTHFAYVMLDEWVIMPNHVHGIIIIGDVTQPIFSSSPDESGRIHDEAGDSERKPLSQIIGAFKSRVTKLIRRDPGRWHDLIWQRNYYEHVIRNEGDLDATRQYIRQNPLNWTLKKDRYYRA
jgi:putative transposase